MKILLAGIFFVCLNTFTGSSFDTITKYLSINNYKWYHYYSIGGTAAIILFLIFLNFIGGIKKHLILQKPNHYFLAILRGFTFIPVLLIVFFSLKHIPINIFTMLLMTTPFFLLICAKFVLNEKLNFISWIAIIIGFSGVIIVLRPNMSNLSVYLFLVICVAIYNAFNFTIVSKYSHIATSYGFTFYHYVPFTLFSYVFYHVAGKYSSIISPFFFTQIIWASLFGKIFFGEQFDTIAIVGIIIIVISGTIAIYNRNK